MVFVGKRRYDRKQSGYGGQTKPIFHKKVSICVIGGCSLKLSLFTSVRFKTVVVRR